MDIHPSRELVASGQRAGRDRKSQAHVRIWSTESLQTLYVFGMGELDKGVTSVAFSQLVSDFSLEPEVIQFTSLHLSIKSRMEEATYWQWMQDVKVSCPCGSGSGDTCWEKLQ